MKEKLKKELQVMREKYGKIRIGAYMERKVALLQERCIRLETQNKMLSLLERLNKQ